MDSGHVGKYDALWVIERADGLRWSVFDGWVTEESNNFTSWTDADLEFADDTLDPGGRWVNINEV